jgi:predicted PurR-regulated permease PerM
MRPASARRSRRSDAEGGHDYLVGQPHSDLEGPVAEAEAVAEKIRSDKKPLGRPGKPLDRRSPFFIGISGAAGVAVTAGLVKLVLVASDALVLTGVAFFIATGLDPPVSWLARRGLRRGLAVTVVVLAFVGSVVGFFAAVITPLVDQATQFIHQLTLYLQKMQDNSSLLGQLNDRLQLQQRLQRTFSGPSPAILQGVLGAGKAILGTLIELLVVLVLSVYFLADFPRIRRVLYRLVPRSRRPRAILIGDQIFAKVGAYVLGNVLVSLIAGAITFVWLTIMGVPYAVLLSVLVAVLDLVPVVGSTTAGVVVSLTALIVSLLVCLATVAFFVCYRLIEDWLLAPKIIGRVVKIPALVTVVAVILGGVLLGVTGALVAIPIAAALLLIVREGAFPRLDQI